MFNKVFKNHTLKTPEKALEMSLLSIIGLGLAKLVSYIRKINENFTQ